MTPRTKHMTLGAALGAAGTAIAIGLFHGRKAIAAPFLSEQPRHEHEKHKHENERGEYGRKKKHHHREH
jgi:hypothetical protein